MDQWINQSEVISLAKKLISIQSHKENQGQEFTIAHFIKDVFKAEKIMTELEEIEPHRPNVYGFLPGSNSGHYFMFNGHTDTVPGFNMEYDPFKPFIENGRLYGRGSVDMKGALAAMISAMIAIKRKGIPLKEGVVFAGVIDEEQCCKGTERIVRTKVIEPTLAIIGEPTNLKTAIAHKGMEWIEVTFQGLATHGSTPRNGINAIYLANEFLTLLRNELEPKLEKKIYPLLGSATINPGVLKGGNDPNIVPDHCILQIDRRWLPSESILELYEEIEEIATKAIAKCNGGSFLIKRMDEATAALYNMPHSISPDDPFVIETLRISENITKVKSGPVAFPGWSDGAQLSNNLDTSVIVLGPGDITQAHSNNEFCSIDQIWQATHIYYSLIEKFCM
ncbi:acetylornithine deacetylase/succinyl-diaminopimelate desuccinylase [Tindallia magadiensis]|uniref:Acetylornithine deacetylase/succinyl-diaminopimelate desuccinylase n=1 Tax=Tindallia magadiensis TaxID=69895 RepID=A0A1I3C9U7_9FIRM|nr:M20 family metallopeptidase [Tindallia magadiensis]SFH71257.1 acetylornithine deacetylase/succinyl-diaminopimelate desuccinylase [Tindallia magadiensis]